MVGHRARLTLLVIGLPLIFFKSELPAWLESGAEKAVGIVILLLAARVIYKWLKGDYRAAAHAHRRNTPGARHLRRGEGATPTVTCARRARPSASACCTAWPAPAPSCCC